jgi:hypothetical protein
MIKVSIDYLNEFSQKEASELIGKDVDQPGVYRFVTSCGYLDDFAYLGRIQFIDVDDIDPESENFFLEREDGLLYANDSEDCAPATYILVGDYAE